MPRRCIVTNAAAEAKSPSLMRPVSSAISIRSRSWEAFSTIDDSAWKAWRRSLRTALPALAAMTPGRSRCSRMTCSYATSASVAKNRPRSMDFRALRRSSCLTRVRSIASVTAPGSPAPSSWMYMRSSLRMRLLVNFRCPFMSLSVPLSGASRCDRVAARSSWMLRTTRLSWVVTSVSSATWPARLAAETWPATRTPVTSISSNVGMARTARSLVRTPASRSMGTLHQRRRCPRQVANKMWHRPPPPAP